MLLSVSLFTYFICLSLFSLMSHPVYYCVLLVINSLLCSFMCYIIYGFSWYSLLFCLVYIGGVYILFVFVSVHNPNSSVVSYWNFNSSSTIIFTFLCITMGCFIYYASLSSEFSSVLCSSSEGYFYLSLCLTLLFGFTVLSLVMSVKVNHYR
uniref:NADH dehydrogenase subunit 6 n=1 Tax=Rhinebothrium reydai TaxID=2572012 RepID=A0A5B9RU80_9CEST|nr:NADH dehydrogenase subunit 6 [Rhinebothrium reydai]QEG77667.1 NADH dehydrogenase subunit 6 [Rhinebothrium reydai]